MSDLVKRLRNLCNNVEMDKWKHAPDGNLTASNALIEVMGKAADEIERLHEALRLAKDDMLRAVDHIDIDGLTIIPAHVGPQVHQDHLHFLLTARALWHRIPPLNSPLHYVIHFLIPFS